MRLGDRRCASGADLGTWCPGRLGEWSVVAGYKGGGQGTLGVFVVADEQGGVGAFLALRRSDHSKCGVSTLQTDRRPVSPRPERDVVPRMPGNTWVLS